MRARTIDRTVRRLSPLEMATTVVICLGIAVGISLAAIGVPLVLTIAVAGGLAAGIGAATSIEIALALLLVAVSIFNRSELFAAAIPFFGGGLRPTDLLLAVALSGATLRAMLRRLDRRRAPGLRADPLPTVSIVAAGFVAWAVLSSVTSITSGVNYKESLVELRPLLHYLLVIPLVTELSPAAVRRLSRLLVVASAAAGVKAIVLFLGGDTGNVALFTAGVTRVTDVEFTYLIAGIIFALLFHAAREARPYWLIPAAILCLGGLAVTFFRAAWLALGASMLFVLWRGDRAAARAVVRYTVLAALTLPVLAFALAARTGASVNLIVSIADRLASIRAYREDISAQHRLSEWQAALAQIGEQPIAGNGLGTRVGFYSPMYDHKNAKVGFWSYDIYIHNGYLWLATKLGLVGLGLFLGMIVLAFRSAAYALARDPPAGDRALIFAFPAILVALAVASAFGAMFTVDTLTPLIAFGVAAPHVLARGVWTRAESGVGEAGVSVTTRADEG